MRLRKIRLAGFKSFVDPTTIEFPGSVVGVVGPNGGGKSNVIDAVRWVMGEISARSLRGDTMADVVFNGSSSRKPVSQASVELVFDNIEGRAGGRFAAYNEISMRRQVAREGQSTYWLNGTRCRRRDVMDVFHGTGLGPRSYAIIEQGMISRIIEAKPEELRDFIEEAAGISKYKERRRETENRMRHTLENLDRLNDLREELGRRLAYLKRQAALAEKFRELKAAQRVLEAERLALQWREYDEEAGRHAKRVADQENRLDAALAGQRRLEAELEKTRAAYTGATDRYNRSYRDVLDEGAEIARTEESIQSLRRRREELVEALRQETGRLEAAKLQIEGERRQREALATQLERDTPALAALNEEASNARRALREIEEDVHTLQAEYEAWSEREREPAQKAHAERARIQHLDRVSGRSKRGRGRSTPSAARSTPARWSTRRRCSGSGSRRRSRRWRRTRRSNPARRRRCGGCAKPSRSRRRPSTRCDKPSGSSEGASHPSKRCSRRGSAPARARSPNGSKRGVWPADLDSRRCCGSLGAGSTRSKRCSAPGSRRCGPAPSRRSRRTPPFWSRGR